MMAEVFGGDSTSSSKGKSRSSRSSRSNNNMISKMDHNESINDNGKNSLDDDFVQLDDFNSDEDDDDGDEAEDADGENDDHKSTSTSTSSDIISTSNIGNTNSSASNLQQKHHYQEQPSQQRGQLPPWMDRPHPPFVTDYSFHHLNSRTAAAGSTTINPLIALHNEIVAFCKLMEPRPEEMKQRKEVVDRFTTLVESVFGRDTCKVEVFGSQLTGLCLPSSDIDIAIQLPQDDSTDDDAGGGKADIRTMNNTDTRKKTEKQQEIEEMRNWDKPTGSPLQRLAKALRERWIDELSYLEVIENTRVPLVKFKHEPTGISVDVCFNQTSGPQAAALVHSYMRSLPPLRPLTFVLKSFLASRGLNQPYTGGIGSFMLQMMIVSFLQHRERDSLNSQRPSFPNLGALLVEFLEFFSTDFNFITVGISVRYDGFFFPKGTTDRKNDFWNPNRPFSLAMENPLDPTMDVGSPSFRMQLIQRSFEVAFKALLAHVSEPLVPTTSILGEILRVTDEMNQRRIAEHNQQRQQRQLPPNKKQRFFV
jgi:non-canonical poly(A) RNA polymerase PAPD5/7